MSDLDVAISQFPISSWCSMRMKTYDDGGGTDFYADCPICNGRRKLGISRITKVFHCFKCMEGGHGGDLWTGAASLPRMIRVLEGCSWRQAFKMIYELAGLPEPAPRKRKPGPRGLPKDAIPLSDCQDDERAVVMLRERHCGHLRDSSHLCIGGRFNERIILPTYFLGEETGFEAKATSKSQSPPSLFPEWLETDETVYTIRSWDASRPKFAALTESVLDCETFHGICNAVGLYGKFKEGQVTSLLDLDLTDLYWFLDGDAWTSVLRGIKKTRSLFRSFVVPMPTNEDPNSIGPQGCRDLLEKAREIKTDWDLMECALAWGKPLK